MSTSASYQQSLKWERFWLHVLVIVLVLLVILGVMRLARRRAEAARYRRELVRRIGKQVIEEARG